MVHAHADEVLRAGLRVQIHQVLGVPLVALEQGDQVFVARLGRMPVGLEMVFILWSALDIHVAREPITILYAGLRSPMGPNAKLGIAEPLRNAVGVERSACPLEWP